MPSSTKQSIISGCLHSQRERHNPEGRLLGKLALIRRLYKRGYERQAILDLFRFIDWVLELPEDLEIRFRVELEHWKRSDICVM